MPDIKERPKADRPKARARPQSCPARPADSSRKRLSGNGKTVGTDSKMPASTPPGAWRLPRRKQRRPAGMPYRRGLTASDADRPRQKRLLRGGSGQTRRQVEMRLKLRRIFPPRAALIREAARGSFFMGFVCSLQYGGVPCLHNLRLCKVE